MFNRIVSAISSIPPISALASSFPNTFGRMAQLIPEEGTVINALTDVRKLLDPLTAYNRWIHPNSPISLSRTVSTLQFINRRREPIRIDGSILIFYNPVSGGKKGYSQATRIVHALAEQQDHGRIIISGELNLIRTKPDPMKRIPAMIDTLNSHKGNGKYLYVLVVSGDGTDAEVATAVLRSEVADKTRLAFLNGGIANDMSFVCGSARNPYQIAGWLTEAIPCPLDMAEVYINDVKQRVDLIHHLSAGASGKLFATMEKRRHNIGGPLKYLHYIVPMFEEILKTEHFYAVVEDGNGNASAGKMAGEVIIAGTTSAGHISKIPLSGAADGFKAYIVQVDPGMPGIFGLTGTIPLLEASMRRMLDLAGFRRLTLGGDIIFMEPSRQIPIRPGSSITISFYKEIKSVGNGRIDGTPVDGLSGVLNGDLIHGIKKFTIRVPERSVVKVLAAPGSEMDMRKNKK